MSDQTHDPSLRILHVLRAPVGGLFRHVLDLTREQVARGHAVGLVVDETTGGQRAADTLAALAPSLALGVLRLPMHRAPHHTDLATILRVDAHAKRLAADVVHGHGSKGGLYGRLPGYFVRAASPVRCYTPHGGSFNHVANPFVQSFYMAVERMLAARTDVLLFESVFIANRFHQRVGDTQALVRIVQNGIGSDEFAAVAPNADASDFLYVGELRSAKGIDTLLDATAALSRGRHRALSLTLVGAGPDKDKLMRQAEALGIAGAVSFPGAMPARTAFTLGRVLVVPSRAESLPYIVLEAAGARVPMVATDVGGIGEVFGPYRDRLIRCDDPIVLARAMGDLIDRDPTTVGQQADDLAEFVANRFSVAKMTDAVIAGYRDGFARRALPSGSSQRSFSFPS